MIRAIRPKVPSKCPLLGCFYSEFDIKKGTVIVCQSPPSVMDQDIYLPMSEMQLLLQKAFEDLERRGEAVGVLHSSKKGGGTGDVGDVNCNKDNAPENTVGDEDHEDEAKDKINNATKSNEDAEDYEDDDSEDGGNHETKVTKKGGHDGSQRDGSDHASEVPGQVGTITPSAEEPSDNLPPLSAPLVTGGGLSIFDSTSEFIITGTELTSKIITLSAHSWHVMTRPTIISNSRYERNTHLFSVGFLLRRAADPRPFRPLLSKLATTLQAMEEESWFLSRPEYRPKLQTLLERVLLSLNSPEHECNLLLSASSALHLKLYQTPTPETSPVHDYQVPILLRRDLQLQMVRFERHDMTRNNLWLCSCLHCT
jgi:Nitrogen permease regulator 2